MDRPDNYYAILGIPEDADSETIKRAYRQLARRYHPDLAGPEGAVEMKRINRAYDVLSDPDKRLNYDTILGGIVDLRAGGLARPRKKAHRFEADDDIEFSGLSIFHTKGPWHPGARLRTTIGVISTVSSIPISSGNLIAAGTTDGKGLIWQTTTNTIKTQFVADQNLPVESLRQLRFSEDGKLLAGWGRSGLHIWETEKGTLLWSHELTRRAVSAYYSLDAIFPSGNKPEQVFMALPLLKEDPLAPRSVGVRGTDVVQHALNTERTTLAIVGICPEDDLEKRMFWAIRLRALDQNASTLFTLSCAHIPGEQQETLVARLWNLTNRSRIGKKLRPQITTSILMGNCADCAPPYAVTPDLRALAYIHLGNKVRIYDTFTGTYSEIAAGTMGASARMALSPDGQWLAVAREDSEVNEGVIDLWATGPGQLIQKFYHPWQISALHFTAAHLVVTLTDGTIQIWQ